MRERERRGRERVHGHVGRPVVLRKGVKAAAVGEGKGGGGWGRNGNIAALGF